jgi:hypothetical protein
LIFRKQQWVKKPFTLMLPFRGVYAFTLYT